MANIADYRNMVRDRLAGIEMSGYGNFEFLDSELETFLNHAVAGLFPTIHRRVADADVATTEYGTNEFRKADVAYDEGRIYLIEDATERTPILGWSTRPGEVVGLPTDPTTVNIYRIEPWPSFTSYGGGAVGWPEEFAPLIVQHALITALSSRSDSGVRPDPQYGEGRSIASYIETQTRWLEVMKRDLGQNMPGVIA